MTYTTSYKLNLENTGLDNDDQVRAMADAMIADGHAVEFTRDFGAVQGHDDNGDVIACPVDEQTWMRYLEIAAGLRTA